MVNTKESKEKKPPTWQIWWTAARPHTLTASLCPCLVSYAACRPPWKLHIVWTVFCMTVQLGTNLHNDYADAVLGADTEERVGQARATAKGWLTPQQTLRASCTVLLGTFVAGVWLAFATEQSHNPMVWGLILTSVLNAFAYTGGPVPLGYIGLSHWSIAYSGLGDVFCMAYFGFVATLMMPFLLRMDLPWLYALQVGCLATNILVVNNLRDRFTDVKANKRTTAVRFGKFFSLYEYVLLLAITYGLVLLDAFQHRSMWRLLPCLTMPLAKKEVEAIWTKEGSLLNQHVGGAAKLQLAFCVLLAIGLQYT